jgi:DNA-binding GntR family transcriptional regulator
MSGSAAAGVYEVGVTGPQTTPQHALDALRRAIVDGELRPGQRIAQEQVALRLGMSIAPVREALRVLDQEGQVTYRPRRGYFVTELRIEDLEEIYELRKLLEERLARAALAEVRDGTLERIKAAAAECVQAAEAGHVSAELEANRRFHFAILEPSDSPHTIGVIRRLWDATEAYRALYYNLPAERQESIAAHGRIIEAIEAHDADRLVAELDAHRERALIVLRRVLSGAEGSPDLASGSNQI